MPNALLLHSLLFSCGVASARLISIDGSPYVCNYAVRFSDQAKDKACYWVVSSSGLAELDEREDAMFNRRVQ